MPAKGYKKMKQPSIKTKAWQAFAKYVKLRDCLATTGTCTMGVCITCGQKWLYSQLEAGHAIGGRTNSILFDEQLVNAQCVDCNRNQYGNYGKYNIWYINKYGLQNWEEKIALSKSIRQYKDYEYLGIVSIYKDKCQELEVKYGL